MDFLNGKEVVVASHNKGKLDEIRELLEPYGCIISYAADYGLEEPVEDGLTFEENAIIKAKFTCENTGKIAISDDSGLCIDAMGGKPGIHSARFVKECGGVENAFKSINQQIGECVNRNAHYVCALSVAFPGGDIQTFVGQLHGRIIPKPIGDNGFGFDPIFVADGMYRSVAELSDDEKNMISHRASAFKKLVSKLINNGE